MWCNFKFEGVLFRSNSRHNDWDDSQQTLRWVALGLCSPVHSESRGECFSQLNVWFLFWYAIKRHYSIISQIKLHGFWKRSALINMKREALKYMICHFSYHRPYQPSTHISTRAFGPWANMGVSGWYDMWYEKWHIIIYYYRTSCNPFLANQRFQIIYKNDKYIRLKIIPNSVRIIFLSCQICVLPSTGFELTPLLHCSTNRFALCPAS
jgi:hypothetical protein